MTDSKSKQPRGKKAKRQKALAEIAACRIDVEHCLDVLRLGAHRELAFLPKGEKWLLPSVAFALGVALAGGSKKSADEPAVYEQAETDDAEQPRQESPEPRQESPEPLDDSESD